jgi:hypothetical protein
MIDINLATPALLFPAISLLLLAYTNRFLALAALIRQLHATYRDKPDSTLLGQIANLRRRLHLIRDMQLWGVVSIFFCVVAMLLLYARLLVPGRLSFALALISLLISLWISFFEVRISVGALDLQLGDVEEHIK